MIYERSKIKQLKLTTGEEIICEIVEEDGVDLILRNVLQINLAPASDGSNTKYWSFKFYMCYQDDPERFILIKHDKIVAVANPMNVLVEQYITVLGEMVHAESNEYNEPEYQQGWDDEYDEMTSLD